ncbi:MAG: PD40 domain-containing protein [Candidatus Zixiibacteriota bacterium]|nr:MAG: PD40 domain-containing protein [candidate division Zixibacteria bacterium]
MHFLRSTLVAVVAVLVAFQAVTAEESRLMRYPDIYKDKIVFSYGGDLWLVSSEGGAARRLTSHPGEELFPKFSPDGQFIAFTGDYEGGNDVYVVPADGGEPVQLTYHPGGDMVLDWSTDGSKVVFRSSREAHRAAGRKLYEVSTGGGLPTALKIPEAGLASFSPDGTKLAYNRKLREFRTWKRYKGGWAQDIWVYDLKADTVARLTDWEGTDHAPMWAGDRIYFNSDREHTLNIFYYDLKTGKISKVTKHAEYDVKWPSLGPGAIVYENGGYLYVLDLKTLKTSKVPVEVNTDAVLTRPAYTAVADLVGEFNLSPTAKRALFGARGEIFTVPLEKGATRNITRTPTVREIYSTWAPDGKWVAYLSDRTGEYEIYIRAQNGNGEEEQITNDGECYRFELKWSPDSKKILYADKKLRLYYVDIDDKTPVQVDRSEIWQIDRYAWSPDSKWIVYSKPDDNYNNSIFLYSLEQREVISITDEYNNDDYPAFDPDGKYLYFVSNRSFAPTFSDFEAEFIYRNTSNLYLITLQADSLSPFAPESDEEEIEEEGESGDEEKKAEDDGKDDDEKDKDIVIDLENIDLRTVGVPVPPGNYFGLKAQSGKLFYLSAPAVRASDGGSQNELHMYDLEKREDHTVISGIDNYDMSHDGKKIIYKARQTYGTIDASAGSNKVGDGGIDLSGLEMKVDPRGEWEQMFYEAWRLERDFFYDPDMHGVDWVRMKTRYAQLLPYVAHRSDLTYVIGEMIGELCASHAYVGGGKRPPVPGFGIGLLGADLELDPASNRYRFKKIYTGENWQKNRRAPLTEPGVIVNEGDYLMAVNGREVTGPDNPYSYFEKTASKRISITVSDSPSLTDAREYAVVPVASEAEIRYLDWVEGNRRAVSEATDGRVGYIHVPNTSISGLNEFSRAFYAQAYKDGLVVDVRYNGGGMIPTMFLERLTRQVMNQWSAREGRLWRSPGMALNGHMVCVMNEFAGSGGDLFPYYFRQMKLGPLVGNRTWGGLVGIARGIPLMDGGFVTVPEFAFINEAGEWDVENHGVDPDVPVDNRPDLVVAGKDPQLEKSVELVLKKIEEEPPKLPPRPRYPVKK